MLLIDTVRFSLGRDPGAYTRMTGRSCWAMLYSDGSVIYEWERDWSQLPTRGRRAIRLYTPDGQVVEFVSQDPTAGLFLQLKVAIAFVGIGGSSTIAHMVGHLTGVDGSMECAAWRYSETSGSLELFRDNAYNCRWENLGALSTDHLGFEEA